MSRFNLTAPTFDTMHDRRAFKMLRAASVTMLTITLIICTLLITGRRISDNQTIAYFVPLVPAFTLVLAYRGHLYIATWIFVTSLWGTISMSVVAFGGIRVQSFSILVFILLLSFFLFEKNEWMVFLILTIGTGAYAYFIPTDGDFTQYERLEIGVFSPALFAEQVTLLLAISALFYVAKRGYEEAVALAEENRQKLERRSAELEQALVAQRQSEKRFRNVAESSPDALFIVDIDTLEIVEVNQNAVEVFGYTEAQFLEMNLLEIIAETQSESGQEGLPHDKIAEAMAGNTVKFEWDHVGANGRIIPSEVYLVQFPSSERRLIRASLHDITERKRSEKLLHQTDKMRSLGLLAGGVAHDFNNLLVALQGQTSIALAKLEVTHPATRHIVKAVDAAGRASELTQQMLAFSGRGQLAVASIDVNELLTSNFNLFSTTLSKRATIETNLCKKIKNVQGDRSQLQQVLMNLIINAGEAIEAAEGCIIVTTRMIDLADTDRGFWKLTGEPLQAGEYVSISIRDNGIGMSEETVNRIFDPFYTTKSTGSGLGLAAVLGIIRSHSGGLAVYSEEGVGTEFHVVLPAVATEAQDDTLIVEIDPSLQSTGHILIVDDQFDVRETARDILEGHGHSVVLASNGEEGVSRFESMPDAFALVLMDISMPGIDGEEAMHQMRKIDATVPVLLSSGFKRDGDSMDTIAMGDFTSFLQKPYNQRGLLDAVGQLMR